MQHLHRRDAVDEIGVITVGPAEVLAPQPQACVPGERAGPVPEAAGIDRLALVALLSITAHDSSESLVHDRRLRLSLPTIIHTSSITQNFECT